MHYNEIHQKLMRLFNNSIVLTARKTETKKITKYINPNRGNETVLKDLLFPAKVEARKDVIHGREDVDHCVYINGKHQCWSEAQIQAIEKLFNNMFGGNHLIRTFGVSD